MDHILAEISHILIAFSCAGKYSLKEFVQLCSFTAYWSLLVEIFAGCNFRMKIDVATKGTIKGINSNGYINAFWTFSLLETLQLRPPAFHRGYKPYAIRAIASKACRTEAHLPPNGWLRGQPQYIAIGL